MDLTNGSIGQILEKRNISSNRDLGSGNILPQKRDIMDTLPQTEIGFPFYSNNFNIPNIPIERQTGFFDNNIKRKKLVNNFENPHRGSLLVNASVYYKSNSVRQKRQMNFDKNQFLFLLCNLKDKNARRNKMYSIFNIAMLNESLKDTKKRSQSFINQYNNNNNNNNNNNFEIDLKTNFLEQCVSIEEFDEKIVPLGFFCSHDVKNTGVMNNEILISYTIQGKISDMPNCFGTNKTGAYIGFIVKKNQRISNQNNNSDFEKPLQIYPWSSNTYKRPLIESSQYKLFDLFRHIKNYHKGDSSSIEEDFKKGIPYTIVKCCKNAGDLFFFSDLEKDKKFNGIEFNNDVGFLDIIYKKNKNDDYFSSYMSYEVGKFIPCGRIAVFNDGTPSDFNTSLMALNDTTNELFKSLSHYGKLEIQIS